MLEDPPPLMQLPPSLTARDRRRFLNMHVEGNANQDSRDTCNILYLATVMTGWSWVIPRALTCCLNEFIIFQDIAAVIWYPGYTKNTFCWAWGKLSFRESRLHPAVIEGIFRAGGGCNSNPLLTSPPHPSSLFALLILFTGTIEISHVIELPQARPVFSSGVELVWVGTCSWEFGKIRWEFEVYLVSSACRNQHMISQRL